MRLSILGQILAAFCALHHLSQAPQALREVFITGGIPPLQRAYRRHLPRYLPRVVAKNRLYYQRYPRGRRPRAPHRRPPARARSHATRRRAPERAALSQLGLGLGMSDGWETLHYLLEEAFCQCARGARGVELELPAPRGAAAELRHQPDLCRAARSLLHPGPRQCLVRAPATGRVPGVWPGRTRPGALSPARWSTLDVRRLRPAAPLKECAELLAHKADWPQLYDAERLGANTVPVAAAVYDDMYVHREFSEGNRQTDAQGAAVAHQRIRAQRIACRRAHILGKLIDRVRGR